MRFGVRVCLLASALVPYEKRRFPRIACCLTLLVAWPSLLLAAMVSREVLVRDHFRQSTAVIQVTGVLNDSSAGSWVGTRPGVEGLPTPAYDWTVPPIGNRKPLSPAKAELGWPARMAGRLDLFQSDSLTAQRCSGMLVGPSHFLTAAHCVLLGQDDWIGDNLCVRPGYNLKQNAPGFSCIRVERSMVLATAASDRNLRTSDDDWALLELADDAGTELGWAQIGAIHTWKSGSNVHALGYPYYVLQAPGASVDTTSKTDTLCHSWAPLYHQPDLGAIRQWVPDVPGWPGESGSPIFYCPSAACGRGGLRIIGTRWTEQTISSIDSVNSGILAALLKDVKIPSSVGRRDLSPGGISLESDGSSLRGSASNSGQWQILSLDGRVIGAPRFGRELSVPLEQLPRGIALVVFRAPGQAPVTRRWVGR